MYVVLKMILLLDLNIFTTNTSGAMYNKNNLIIVQYRIGTISAGLMVVF